MTINQQIVMIHGGTTFDDYESYLDYLKNRPVDAINFKTKKHWQNNLDKELGNSFEVFAPRMPNRDNARYQEWKIWFEKMIPFISDNIIFIGYSLGGIFLVKYLSEKKFSKKIKAVILIAPPFDDEDVQESLGDFTLSISLEKFSSQTDKIYLLFSKDDPVVPFTHLEKYKNLLPNAKEVVFENKGHFSQEVFLELVDLIKGI